MRWAAGALVVPGLLVSGLLAGCGVAEQDRAEPLRRADLRSELYAEPGTPAGVPSTSAVVYLVEEARLVRQTQPAAGRGTREALQALLDVRDGPGPRRSAVPAGTALRQVSVDGDLVTVDLSDPFDDVRGADQLLAVAQVVWTATESRGVRRVLLLVEGSPVDVPVEDGAVSSGPARREDYRSVGPFDAPGG